MHGGVGEGTKESRAQKNEGGDNFPALQFKDTMSFATRYPLAQVAEQLKPWLTIDPSKQAGLALWEMPVGAGQSLGMQENVDGDSPPSVQFNLEMLAE